MAWMLVTCPESAHLEEIDLEVSPLGLLVAGCSAFREGCPMCPRTCAARLDRRRRETGDARINLVLNARSVR